MPPQRRSVNSSPQAQKLLLSKAFHETDSFLVDQGKGFKLSSGRISPYYVNCKRLLSHPEHRYLVAQMIYERMKDIQDEIDVIGGMAVGAVPIATTLSDYVYRETKKQLRTFVVRSNVKEHGLGLLVEGDRKSTRLNSSHI